jgi:hypothetical protein
VKRAAIKDGTWFSLPMPMGGHAVGLVARRKGPKMLAYFFGPRHPGIPARQELRGLKAADAVMIARVATMGISEGDWPVLGRLDGWSRDDWPIPDFITYSELSGAYFRVSYPEGQFDGVPSETVIDRDDELPEGSFYGHVAAAITLEEWLDKPPKRWPLAVVNAGEGKSGGISGGQSQPVHAPSPSELNEEEEHAVIIELECADPKALQKFAARLEKAVPPEIGEFDGDEAAVDGSSARLYLYGPDADRLWKAIEKIVRAAPIARNASVLLRYGPPEDGVREHTISLASPSSVDEGGEGPAGGRKPSGQSE